MPVWAADQFFQTAIYYQDPDLNTLELNVNNFDDEWTVTEQLKLLPSCSGFIPFEELPHSRGASAPVSRWKPTRSLSGDWVGWPTCSRASRAVAANCKAAVRSCSGTPVE